MTTYHIDATITTEEPRKLDAVTLQGAYASKVIPWASTLGENVEGALVGLLYWVVNGDVPQELDDWHDFRRRFISG